MKKLAAVLMIALAVAACNKKPQEFKNGKWGDIEQEAPLSTPSPSVADVPAAAPGVTSQEATSTPPVPAQPQPAPQQVVVQQQSSSPWMWGIMGYLLGSSGSRTERVIERETVRYVPAPSSPAPSQSSVRASEPKPTNTASAPSKPASTSSYTSPKPSSSSSSSSSRSSSYSSSSRSSSSYGSSSRSSSSRR